MYKNLLSFINYLEKEGELVRITEFCDPVYVIPEITNRESKKRDGGKALYFENTGTMYPVVTNIMGSTKRMLMLLNVSSYEDIQERLDSLIKEITKNRRGLKSKLSLLPTLKSLADCMPKIQKGVPACQEVVQYEPDLSKLPILKCWPLDGGRFITLPLVHTNDPQTGIRNVGMYRMQVFTKNSTGMHWHMHKTGARHYQEYNGDKMPVAVTLGGDPILTYAATAPLPDGIDEYLFAGYLRGEGVKLAKCLTQDIYVPAESDFVLEGYVSKSEAKVMEGPFGDHTGFYSLEDLYPIFHITCVTHRKGAIYPATVVGVPPQEDKYIAEATEKIFLSPIKFAIAPEILDLYLPEEGVGHNFAIVKIKKSYPGHAAKVAHTLWGAGQMMFNKFLIVVDESAGDIRDRKTLTQTILNNYLPKRDTIFSRGPLDVLDHTSPVCGYGGKLCIDATAKYSVEIEAYKSSANITPDNNSSKKFISFINRGNNIPSNSLITVILDENVDTSDTYRCLWLLGGNADAIRDSSFANETLIINACSKGNDPDFKRRWPDIAESSAETKAIVDDILKKIDNFKI